MSEPLYRTVDDQDYCLADSGFCWIQHFPNGAHYRVTTMLDATGTVIQRYIDICAAHGLDDRGTPWFDDLYLDIVVLPSREAVLLDADELEEALNQGAITRAHYDLAWTEARTLLHQITHGTLPLLDLTAEELHRPFGDQRQPQ